MINQLYITSIIIALSLLFSATAWPHQDVWLRNEQGDRITAGLNSVDAYSPKKTCGVCHNYSTITSGYHFQQGFDVMKDGFDKAKPWILSPGMYGGWLPTAAAGRVAAKKNSHVRQIDLSTYDWIGAGKISPKHRINNPSCGSCHPGGGPLEYGRDSQGRADWSKNHLAGEATNPNPPDGDYSSRFTPDKKSAFRHSGVVEADCLICHNPGYRLADRSEQLYRRNYRWSATAGAGLGIISGAVFTYSNPAAGPGQIGYDDGVWNLAQRPVVSYHWSNRRLFTAEGRLQGSLIKKNVSAQSCLQCHAAGEAKNTGAAFSPTTDVHIQAGMNCTDCHPLIGKTKAQRLTHQIAKGKSLTNHVREDLDGLGMRTCVACHSDSQYSFSRRGVKKQAANPRATHEKLFAGAAFHTYLISCQSCHITALPLRALTILDMSAGLEDGYTAENYQGASRAEDYLTPAAQPWFPWQTRTSKYLPVVPKHLQWFGEKMKNGEIRPIALHHVSRAARLVSNLTTISVNLPDGKKAQRRTAVSDRDITEMIRQLTGLGFSNVVYVSDRIYELKNGQVAAAPLRSGPIYYAAEHGVTALVKKSAYGGKGRPDGCMQCHDDAAPFFAKKDIQNIREFMRKDYPALKDSSAAMQYEIWGLRSVPAFE